jgi:predicted metal-dependent hydrolase
VQLDLFNPCESGWLTVGTRSVPGRLVRNPRARRYLLRVCSDCSVRVTVPRGGSVAEASRFAERHLDWVARQLDHQASRLRHRDWRVGSTLLFRGDAVCIECLAENPPPRIRFGSEIVEVPDPTGDLRPALEQHLRRLAARELPPRVLELAALHQVSVCRVTVRNQRSRWGSCSRRGTISLNWRLVQTPPFVRDYLMLHELAHLRQMNHSSRFWKEVERLCPGFADAEQWLKKHSSLLR